MLRKKGKEKKTPSQIIRESQQTGVLRHGDSPVKTVQFLNIGNDREGQMFSFRRVPLNFRRSVLAVSMPPIARLGSYFREAFFERNASFEIYIMI